MQKASWSRDQKLAVVGWAVGGLIAVVIGLSAFFVPEFRRFLHLDKPTANAQVAPPSSGAQHSSEPIQNSEPAVGTPKPKVSQHTTARVKGNGNVAGNNVAGNSNVTGNGNQTAPIAVAPNGIAIAGGNVTNPTVNNFAPTPPHVTWKMATNESGIIVSINSDKMLSNVLFTVTCDSPCNYASMNMGVYALMSTSRRVNDRTWEFGIGQFNPSGTLEIQFSGDAGFKVTDVATRF